MKRGKQIFLFLLILSLCGGYAFWKSDLHLSPKGAMEAEERGLRYGPSEEILLTYEKENGSQVLIGRWEKGLSAVCVEPKWGRFWRTADLESGFSRCLPITEHIGAFLIDRSYIVGLSCLPEVTEVTCYLNVWSQQVHENLFLQEITMEVAENGFFYGEVNISENEIWDGCTIGYLEGRTAAGEVVFQNGEKKKLTAYPNGEGYIIKDLDKET